MWRRTRLKYLVSLRAGTWGGEQGEGETDVYCVRAADFDRERLRVSPARLPLRSVEASVATELRLAPGDVVLEKSGGGPDQPVGAAALFDLDMPAVCSNFAARVRPHPGVDGRFINYLLAAMYFAGVTESLAKKTTGIANLDVGALMAMQCEVPDAAAQRRIADYLDAETAGIDSLVDRRRQHIGLLNARTEALIASVLDPLIADHGEVPLKAVADVRFSSVDKKPNEDEISVRLCNYTDVYYHRTIDASLTFMEATATADEVARFTLRAGDVLVTKDSETPEDIGIASVVTDDIPRLVLGYHLALARPNGVDGRFLCWSLRSRRCRDALSLAASGVTRFGLRQDALGRVPIPRLDARTASHFVRTVDSQVALGDAMSRSIARQIGTLRERRRALIAAAVSGQAEIPGVAA